MIIEILGAKMLAPYFGTSHFVWTAQIAVTLVALATGYYAGGTVADLSPKLGRLYGCILLAALYLSLTTVMVESVAYWCLKFKLAIGSLLASAFLFFVPLALLAMVGPFFIRVLTSVVSTVGGTIGRLTAVSTIGSFLGTVLIGYVLVPLLPNSTTMYLTSGLLMAIVAGYYLIWATRAASKTAPALGIALGLVMGYGGITQDQSLSDFDEMYHANSNFGLLQVLQNKDGTRRYYLNDFLIQNTYDPVEKKSLALFTYMLHDLARAYTERIDDALCIGLGVGIVPMHFAREGVKVDVIEINSAVVQVATNHFDCDLSQLNLSIGDGRYFLNRSEKKYDTVILDAFLGDSSPSHLMSQQAFRAVQRVLKPGGTLVINSFGDFLSGRDFFTASLDKTLKSVFGSVLIHAAGNGNVFFVASDRATLKMIHEPSFDHVHRSVARNSRDAFASLQKTNPQSGILLTDDYNPVEFYDAVTREEHRRNLAMFMKSLRSDPSDYRRRL